MAIPAPGRTSAFSRCESRPDIGSPLVQSRMGWTAGCAGRWILAGSEALDGADGRATRGPGSTFGTWVARSRSMSSDTSCSRGSRRSGAFPARGADARFRTIGSLSVVTTPPPGGAVIGRPNCHGKSGNFPAGARHRNGLRRTGYDGQRRRVLPQPHRIPVHPRHGRPADAINCRKEYHPFGCVVVAAAAAHRRPKLALTLAASTALTAGLLVEVAGKPRLSRAIRHPSALYSSRWPRAARRRHWDCSHRCGGVPSPPGRPVSAITTWRHSLTPSTRC